MPLLIALIVQATTPTPPAPKAQPPATILVEPAAMLLAACDADSDAHTTRAERDACLARALAAAEGGGSGKIGYISYADWARTWLGDPNALPSAYEVDADGDNRITAAELTSRFTALFDRYDADKNGALTRSELVTIRAQAPSGPEDERRRSNRRRR